jgi:hypothetical protein
LKIEPQPSSASETSSPAPARKPYKAPHLQVYGDLAEITKGQNSGGQNDGSGHPNRHFTS